MNKSLESKQMDKQTPNRIKNILSFLLLVSLIMLITVTSASAVAEQGGKNSMPSAPHLILAPAPIHIGEDDNNAGYGSRDYKIGSQVGSQNGYKKGYNAGLEDCIKHGQQGVLTKFDNPEVKDKWSGNYKKAISMASKTDI
jgi:hypothetical protein